MAVPDLQIILRSPEITLKGRNQGDFWSQLRINVRHVLRRHGLSWPVKMSRGRLYVEARSYTRESLRSAMATLRRVSGVSSLAPAVCLKRREIIVDGELDRAAVEEVLVALAAERYQPGRTFAIRVHRVDKRFPMPSAELETWLGQTVRERTDWDAVDLDDPDQTFYIDIYTDRLFLYGERPKGMGGLPIGCSGSVLSLLSGGIDSPVASYMMARRGCTVDWFHMSATHVTEEDFESSVPGRLARQLSHYTMRSRLFVVPYTHFDLALRGHATGFEPVLFRRFLFRVAEVFAKKTRAVSLVTGDSLSQVASQTIENLIASDQAIDFPVLRPLVGLDKQEIMKRARRIGTYDISIEPYKDCCALYARRVRTKTQGGVLSAIEDKHLGDYGELVASSVGECMWAEYDCGALVKTHQGIRDAA